MTKFKKSVKLEMSNVSLGKEGTTMNKFTKIFASVSTIFFALFIQAQSVLASEADLIVPDFKANAFSWKLLLGMF